MSDRKLGQFLLERGLVRPEVLKKAQELQGLVGAKIESVLLSTGRIRENALLEAKGEVYETKIASDTDLAWVDQTIVRMISPRVARRFQVVPYALDGKVLSVAAIEPIDLLVEDEIAILTGCRVQSAVALEPRVRQALARLYEDELSPFMTTLLRQLDGVAAAAEERAARVRARAKAASKPAPVSRAPAAPSVPPERPATPPSTRRRRDVPDELEISPEDMEMFPSLAAAVEEERAAGERGLEHQPEAAAHETAAAPPEPAAAPEPATPDERLELAAIELQQAEIRDDIADAVLGFAAGSFRRSALLIIRKEKIIGWRGEGEGVERSSLRAIEIPTGEPSVFFGLLQGQEFWLGTLPPMPRNYDLILGLGGDTAPECVILPIAVRGKTVCFFYGDNVDEPLGSLPMSHLRRLTTKASLAFEAFILRTKIRQI